MSIAFIGVQRLVTKVINTCATISASNQSFSSAHGTSGAQLIKVNPNKWTVPNELLQDNVTQFKTESQNFSGVIAKSTSIPLRVMRVMDQGSSPLNAGRMVMSGRFADVCAELDRLTEHQNNLISFRK